MQRSLGKMSAYKMFNWRDRHREYHPTDHLSLPGGRGSHRHALDPDTEGCAAPADGAREHRIRSDLRLRPAARRLVHALLRGL
jgi:hypothetical protein